ARRILPRAAGKEERPRPVCPPQDSEAGRKRRKRRRGLRAPGESFGYRKVSNETTGSSIRNSWNDMAVCCPLDVRPAGIGGLGSDIHADIGILVPFGVAVAEGEAAAAVVARSKGGGVGEWLADIRLLLGVAVKWSFVDDGPAFTKEHELGGIHHH